jgi:chromosomal replication initiation ATPase DnaA
MKIIIKPELEEILETVSQVCFILPEKIKSNSRKRLIAESRHLFTLIAYECGYSFPEITKFLTYKRVANSYSKNRALELNDIDADYRLMYYEIKNIISSKIYDLTLEQLHDAEISNRSLSA